MKKTVTCKTLLGHRNLSFSIQCLQSFINNCYDDIILEIFEDGSIDCTDEKTLLRELKNAIIVFKRDRDEKIEENLKHFPRCLHYRNQTNYAQKLFDVMLYDDKDLLFIDSDIFFLQKFRFPSFDFAPIFMKDSEDAYSFHPLDFLKINIPIFPKINSGFFYFPRRLFNLSEIEQLLTNERIVKGLIRQISWSEQTIWALLAAKNEAINYFDSTQVLMAKKEIKIESNTIAVHLVSTYRFHFTQLKIASQNYINTPITKQIKLEEQVFFLNKFQFMLGRIIKKVKRYL